MFITILGLLLILIPFLTIFCFKEKKYGFLYISAFLICFHLILALVTQSLHIFNYSLIISANLILAIICVYLFLRYKKPISKITINWLAIIAFSIIFFELWSVHYNYTGPVSSINGETYTRHQVFKYPYFSDEWVGVSLTKYSINTHSLPNINPMNQSSFVNPMVAHFSLLAELFLILGLDPLIGFPIFSLVTGFLICLLIYFLLRINSVRNFLAIIITLGIPFIVNGSSLPGIWYLLPFITSLIALLLSLIAFSTKNMFGFITSFIAFLLYPPMAVFIAPVILFYLMTGENKKYYTIKNLLIIFALGIIFSLIIVTLNFSSGNFTQTFEVIKSFILRTNIDDGVPNLAPWLIIPYYLIFLIPFGIYQTMIKKKYFLLTPFMIGVIFWMTYTFTQKVFIIDHYRITTITSILTTIIAGFGLEYLYDIYKNKFKIFNNKILKIIAATSIFLYCFIISFSYTQRLDWMDITLKTNSSNLQSKLSPLAPATEFLTAEDIKIFQNIQTKRFIAPQWKALTIAAATDNFPTETKASTMTVNIISYNDFTNMNCVAQSNILNKNLVNYMYIRRTDCPNYHKIGQSQEGLLLYEYKNE